MTLVLQQIQKLEELYQIRELYISSFPAGQRDSFEGLKHQFEAEKDCSIFFIKTGRIIAGFFTLWRFSDFSYLEHIATYPQFRCKGTGREALGILLSWDKKPLLLEVEKPYDELSHRRLQFYRRNGFQVVTTHYRHPWLNREIPGRELQLMCNRHDLENAILQGFIRTLYQRVYQVDLSSME